MFTVVAGGGVCGGAGRTIVGIATRAGAEGGEGSEEDPSELEADADSVGVYDLPPDDWRVVSTDGRNASTGGKDVRGDLGGIIKGEGGTHRVKIDFVPMASDGIVTGINSVS